MKKTIILLAANLQQGGQERVAVNTAEILRNDYNVILVVFDSADMAYYTDLPVINLSIPSNSSAIYKIINVFRRAQKLNKLIKDKNVDTVYSFGATANLVNVLAKRSNKSIISIRGYRASFFKRYERILYRRADVIIGVSKIICKTITESAPEFVGKTKTLYNPYDIDGIIKKGNEVVEDYHFTKNTIISLGRLNKVKNFPRLIKAFSIVHKEIEDAKLLILGEGDEREELELLIEKYKLQNSVTLLGYRANTFAYLSKSTVYVLSSFNEGFPNSLVEGMCFLPVISVDCKSGPREILSEESIEKVTKNLEIADYGVLVEPAASYDYCESITSADRSLANAIINVLNDIHLQDSLKEKARSRVCSYSFKEYHNRLIEIISCIRD